MSGRPITNSSARDDLSAHRYMLTHPEGVAPLCEQYSNSDCKYFFSFLSSSSRAHTLGLYPDFFPWKKTREEDTLAIQNLQKGWNPVPTVTNEYTPARTAMLPIFKQRSSFYALSYFMLGAMDIKERRNRITSNSTFKPPPRVTLTEQKKEAWLRDLANPAVPLRRLSRTIPHGTRNRSLLEQCCTKSIPIPRAVWFARCVGANELRGLKRKGSSQAGPVTEAQWIHEWTDQVTEFIEKVIKDCSGTNNPVAPNLPVVTSPTNTSSSSSPNTQSKGKPAPKAYNSPTSSISKLTTYHPTHLPWKSKMEYMIKLSTSMFLEDLLDKPLFLKWCVVNFQRCKLDELPIALLFLRLYWNDIIQSRILSQRLALALLERLAELSTPNYVRHPTFTVVRDKVCEYLQSFFLLSPDSFVFPNHWKEMGPVLSEAMKSIDIPVAQELLDFICMRNESLVVAGAFSVRALRNPRYLIIDALDKAQIPYNWTFLAQNIHSNKISEQDALTTAFEWATTVNRTGVERVYICSSLLTEWHDVQKWNISEAFLNFLDLITNPEELVLENLYDLVAEFVDRDWFHPSTYFRRLISQGIIFIDRLRPSAMVKIKVLTNMPVYFSSSLKNQQIMLLKGLKLYDDTETFNVEQSKTILLSKLDFLSTEEYLNSHYFELSKEDAQVINSLSKGSQQELSSWIMNLLDSKLKHGLDMSVSQFAMLQNVFEILRDFKSLYRLIETLVSQTSNGSLLYIMANTTRGHLPIFAAIADVFQLVQLFVTQYKSVKIKSKMSQGLWDLTHFALAQLPECSAQLRTELEQIICPPGQSPLKDITTLSPMSDGVVEGAMASQELGELFEEEQLGTLDNFDIRKFPKLFSLASQKFLDACKVHEDYEEPRKLVKMLQHLRDLDPNMFSDLLTTWIRDKVEPDPALYYDSSSFTRVLLFLVIYECLPLEKAADIFLQLLSVKLPGSTQSTKLMLSLIAEDYFSNIQLKASEKLALNMQRRQFERDNAATYLKYIYQEILDTADAFSPNEALHSNIDIFLLRLISLDLNLVITKLVDPIIQQGNASATNSLRLVLAGLVKTDNFSQAPKVEIMRLLETFNHLNLPLCQVYMRVVLACQRENLKSQGHTNVEDSLLGTLLEVISGAEANNLSERALGDLMIYLPADIKHWLLARCELMFIQSTQFPRVVNMDTGKGNILIYLLEVVDAIADSAQLNVFESNAFEVIDSLDKLSVACEQVKDEDDEDEAVVLENTAAAVTAKDLRSAILLFVKIIMIHSPRLSDVKGHESLRDKIAAGLGRILGTPFFVGRNGDLYGLLMDTLNAIKGGGGGGGGGIGNSNCTGGPAGGSGTTTTTTTTTTVFGEGTTISGGHPISILGPISATALSAAASQCGLRLPARDTNYGSSGSGGGRTTTTSTSTAAAVAPKESGYLTDLIMYNKATKKYSAVNVRTFDLLEESNHTMAVNDVAVNLAMFDGIIEKKNPV